MEYFIGKFRVTYAMTVHYTVRVRACILWKKKARAYEEGFYTDDLLTCYFIRILLHFIVSNRV